MHEEAYEYEEDEEEEDGYLPEDNDQHSNEYGDDVHDMKRVEEEEMDQVYEEEPQREAASPRAAAFESPRTGQVW